MKKTTLPQRLGIAALLAAAAAVPAHAGLITNGSFESGFAAWTSVDQLGSDGAFFVQSGAASPVNGMPVPAPPSGTFAAMTDAQAGGSHVLYQDFVVPVALTSYTLGFSLFLNNGADAFYTPSTLDWATPVLNQQARVDIIRTSADPFSVAGGDILQTIYQTNVGDPLTSGYNSLTFDVTALLQANQGATLRLRFSEVDNVSFFQMGVDGVDIVSGTPNQNVPEILPWFMEWVTLAGVLLAAVRYHRTNRRATVHA
jgi:hypothetical protein